MRAIAGDGYKVSISGTAADELFSGYYDHHLAYLHDIKLQSQAMYDTARLQWELQIAPHVRNPFLQDADYFILHPDSRDHIYLGANDTKSALKVDFSESFSENAYVDQLLRNRMLNELFHETVPLILHEDDLNAMYFSIENRSPYLDSDLYLWSRSIPSQYLVHDGLAKAPLRWAVSDLLPQGVALNSHKVGFNASMAEFLPGNLSRAQEIVRESVLTEWFEPKWIESLFDREFFTNSQSKLAFSVLTSAMFLEEYA
jgi:asparagine synthase (glutamine-hydrolysing)